MKAMVISNMEADDITFECVVDGVTWNWNVTRAVRDCAAGKYELYRFSVADALQNFDNVTVDDGKVAAMVADPERLDRAPPLIFVQESGRIYLIDGHHRLRALAYLGKPHFAAYVIEEEDAAPYRVWFNGKRSAPWQKGWAA